MLTFVQEVLRGLEQNTITRLDLFVTQDLRKIQFLTYGPIGSSFEVSLPADCVWRLTSDTTFYIDQKPYSKNPLFSKTNFNLFKDALLLNISLKWWSNNTVIFSKEQCDYLDRIIQRNINLSQRNGITLFHYSAMYGDINVVQMYSWRAKEVNELEVKCQAGKTPLDYARAGNHLSIVSFLENKIKKVGIQQTKAIEVPISQINKPLSDINKQHIFDSLRLFGILKPEALSQKLIAAALANIVFPPVFKTKLVPLQLAYQANKGSTAMQSLLANAIQIYFNEEGVSLFNVLLNSVFVSEDWNPGLIRTLAGYEIIVPENPYVEATIQDGKIYWCIIFGNQPYYYRASHKHAIDQAMTQNQSWRLTWKEFRVFKDAGKRTGTVSITEDRFVNAILPYVNNDAVWAKIIWQELRNVGILDRKLRLSQAWYPFSNANICLNTIGIRTDLYQHISNILQQIANNNMYQETVGQDMTVYRPARVSKHWRTNGLVENCEPKKSEFVIIKRWDVGVVRELRDHAVTQDPACDIDHIPSRSQIMNKEDIDYWNIQLQNCDTEITKIQTALSQYNGHNLRSTFQHPNCLQASLNGLFSQKQNLINAKKENAKGLSFWGIYINRDFHHGYSDTHGVSKAEQKNLDFYSSVSKYISILKKELDPPMFLQALGAFRYMYARMCKTNNNIAEKCFISGTPNTLFDYSKKRQIDDFFIKEMQSFANSRLDFR